MKPCKTPVMLKCWMREKPVVVSVVVSGGVGRPVTLPLSSISINLFRESLSKSSFDSVETKLKLR